MELLLAAFCQVCGGHDDLKPDVHRLGKDRPIVGARQQLCQDDYGLPGCGWLVGVAGRTVAMASACFFLAQSV